MTEPFVTACVRSSVFAAGAFARAAKTAPPAMRPTRARAKIRRGQAHLERRGNPDQTGVTKRRDGAQENDPRERGRGRPDADDGQATQQDTKLRPPVTERGAVGAHDLVAREDERGGGREEREEVTGGIPCRVGESALDRDDRLERSRQTTLGLAHRACRRRRVASIEEDPPLRRRHCPERSGEEDRRDSDREHHRAEDDQRVALLHLEVVIRRGGAVIAACAAMRLATPTRTSASTVAPSMKKNASALSAAAVTITLFRAALNSSPCAQSC